MVKKAEELDDMKASFQFGLRKRGYNECISNSNTPYTYKVRTFKHIRQEGVKTCGFLRSNDWKRKKGILVLSDFKYSDFCISVFPQDYN